MDKFCLECYRTVSKYSSSESYLKTELLRHNTDPEVAEIRITKRKAKRGEQAVKVVSCIACRCIQHNLYPKVVEQSSYERIHTACLMPNKQLRSP